VAASKYSKFIQPNSATSLSSSLLSETQISPQTLGTSNSHWCRPPQFHHHHAPANPTRHKTTINESQQIYAQCATPSSRHLKTRTTVAKSRHYHQWNSSACSSHGNYTINAWDEPIPPWTRLHL